MLLPSTLIQLMLACFTNQCLSGKGGITNLAVFNTQTGRYHGVY